MLKKVEAKCKRCEKEFCRKRTEQEFCSGQCRNAAWKNPRKRRLKSTPLGSVANGPFFSIKTETCERPSTPDLGAFVRAQIVAQKEESNPIGFSLPDGPKGRVWLANARPHSKIIGDERHSRVNTEELLRQRQRRPKTISWLPRAEALNRPIIVVGRNDPVRGFDDALGTVKGFRLRICIDGEKELQILGCGWRIVVCQLRGDKVILHHHGKVATMKCKAFKELLAANRVVRPPYVREVCSEHAALVEK